MKKCERCKYYNYQDKKCDDPVWWVNDQQEDVCRYSKGAKNRYDIIDSLKKQIVELERQNKKLKREIDMMITSKTGLK